MILQDQGSKASELLKIWSYVERSKQEFEIFEQTDMKKVLKDDYVIDEKQEKEYFLETFDEEED